MKKEDFAITTITDIVYTVTSYKALVRTKITLQNSGYKNANKFVKVNVFKGLCSHLAEIEFLLPTFYK